MWVYVVISYSERTKVGREAAKVFINGLVKKGFQKMNKNLYFRYFFDAIKAEKYKCKIKEQITQRLQVSILIIGDKQNESNYHFSGRKNKEIALYKPKEIEFF